LHPKTDLDDPTPYEVQHKDQESEERTWWSEQSPDDEDSRRAVEKHSVYRPQHQATPVHKKAKKTEFVEKVKYLGSADS